MMTKKEERKRTIMHAYNYKPQKLTEINRLLKSFRRKIAGCSNHHCNYAEEPSHFDPELSAICHVLLPAIKALPRGMFLFLA